LSLLTAGLLSDAVTPSEFSIASMLAPFIGEEFRTSVVVENRAGGGSTIGTQAVAKAGSDGLTIGMMDAAFVANPSLMSNLPYDTLKDFAPIVLVATSPLVMVVDPAIPAQNVKEFVAYGKANPGKLSFGSAGRGTGVHLAAEQFRTLAGLDMIHVPYKGTGEAVTALAGGQITTLFTTQFGSKPMLDAGRLRVLGITGARRGSGGPGGLGGRQPCRHAPWPHRPLLPAFQPAPGRVRLRLWR
jgi:tripartite-type tricarboxylate transporter receptor subunit TctC